VCDWFAARGVRVSYSNAGNFVWVNLGEVAGIKSAKQEKRVFQRLLDGGVYIVCRVILSLRRYEAEKRGKEVDGTWRNRVKREVKGC
jgi:hypothetical protein